ncbi:tripartite tricarboxylate transporter substrate binding protein [Comamonas sp. C11]|uniref:Bug family tripartite tricarboxylate transporter substrate binding protein n=1 Tax=Comamonas sp. C11 TaxID=2966554 RepID=UPI002111B903|nr:tripartite tricarboxylate transporter substrate binding protein [Comamonas sp. C11]UUC96743.1 tripartite tricarboxylate transporter substrate binding protein [Comamonas sp. C11]
MNAMRWNRRQFSSVLLALSTPLVQAAPTWPSKPIRIVVPFTTGGSLDILSRAIGVHLGQALGQPVVVDNKAGAGGVIGSAEVARAAPDGYTFVMGNIGTHVVNPLVLKSLPYDPVKDFTPISLVQSVPMVLAVSSSLGINTLQELISLAKAKPDSITIASPGHAHYLAIARLGQAAGVKFRIVPYKGPAQSITDAVGGHIAAVLDTGMAILPAVRSGGLKILAIASERRLAMLDGVPTFMEVGVPKYEVSGTNVLYGPAGLPDYIVAKLSRELRRIVATPEISNLIINSAGVVVNSTPEQLAQWQIRETEVWRNTIVENNLKFE